MNTSFRITHFTMAALLAFSLAGCGNTAVSEDSRSTDEGVDGHGHDGASATGGASAAATAEPAGPGVERTTIAASVADANGIRVQPVAGGTIADEHEVQGLLVAMDGRNAQVTARYPGQVRKLHANVGDRVRAGQVLASIESNLSLTTYTVRSPIAGVVLSRPAILGSTAGEGGLLYEVADLSSLWVDLHIFGKDTQHIVAGVPVTVTRMTDGVSGTTVLERILPGTSTASQSTIARATLPNTDGFWRPGAAVKARIAVSSIPAAHIVPITALQSMDGNDVVFVRKGDVYSAVPVQLGARDAVNVEVKSGIAIGDQVVVEQSYLVKADIEKSGASHAH